MTKFGREGLLVKRGENTSCGLRMSAAEHSMSGLLGWCQGDVSRRVGHFHGWHGVVLVLAQTGDQEHMIALGGSLWKRLHEDVL